jgi:hypothetical protein
LARAKVYSLYIETLPNERNAAHGFLGPPSFIGRPYFL